MSDMHSPALRRSDPPVRLTPARPGPSELITSVLARLQTKPSRSPMRAIERALIELTGAQALSISEQGDRGVGGMPGGCDTVAARLPLPMGHGVLVAVPERGRAFGVGDFDLLRVGAALAALAAHLDGATGEGPRAIADATLAQAPALVGSSAAMRRLRQQIDRIARTDFTVVVEGESGSGKELVARQIHAASARVQGPFVAVNCAALVESLLEAELFGIEDCTATGVRGRRGKFEIADGGTLFLDEIADLSSQGQAKLLRVLQDRVVERVGGTRPHRIDVRIIAATNRSLAELVHQGRFRLDLYYRLIGVEVHVPPLRARRGDIPELVDAMLARQTHGRRYRLARPALEALGTYEWPGNVRELERTLERAVALAEGDEIGVGDLPPAVTQSFVEILGPALEARDTLRDFGARYARLVLDRCHNRKRVACRALGISYHTLQAYLRRLPGEPRPAKVDPKGPTPARVGGSRVDPPQGVPEDPPANTDRQGSAGHTVREVVCRPDQTACEGRAIPTRVGGGAHAAVTKSCEVG